MIDRKALKRTYLDAPTRAGVYAVRSLATGRTMVAGSGNVQGTLNRHRFELRQGHHRDAGLQRDWNAHGEASFVFEVLDVVRPREDPDFDVDRELALMVELWRQEVPDRSTTPRVPPA